MFYKGTYKVFKILYFLCEVVYGDLLILHSAENGEFVDTVRQGYTLGCGGGKGVGEVIVRANYLIKN